MDPPLGPSSPGFSMEAVRDFDSVHDEWAALAAGTGNIFATWEWSAAWWRHFGRQGRLLLRAYRARDGRLVAVVPLYLWLRRPLRVARLIGHHAGDELGPIALPHERELAAAALREALEGASIDVFVGEQLAASAGWDALPGASVLSREGSPALNLEHTTWDEYLAGKSRNFREQVRRRERKLIREHALQFRLADDPGRLSADLDLLFRLHRERWAGRKTNFSSREAFHREFAEVASRRGWLRLWFAELDGEPAAAWYGFRISGVESYYQAGRSQAAQATSIGFVLLAHSIREAFGDGMREYRFLRGDEEFKYRFADSDPALETIAIARGLARLAVGGAIMLRAARRVGRRLG